VQATELSVPLGDTVTGCDHVEPFHCSAPPDSSTAAQNVEVGHETP
jgi:hypothetical protein